MFKLFKRKEKEVIDTEVLIEEIHLEFDTAADKLLEKAKEAIDNRHVDVNTLQDLKQLGFNNCKSVKEAELVVINQKETQQKLDYIIQAQQKWPLYKFITYEKVIELCKKYNLAFGITENYTGEIPKRCINQMKEYLSNRNLPKDTYYYTTGIRLYNEEKAKNLKSTLSRFRIFEEQPRSWNITYSSISNLLDIKFKDELDQLSDLSTNYRNGLMICAPITDMSISDFKVTKHIPDPIVLAKCPGGFLVVSKWGIEASDPLVINGKMN